MTFIKNLSSLAQIALIVLSSFVSVFSAAGDVDQTFITTTGTNQTESINASAYTVSQPDGKILVFGAFNNVNATPRRRLARLNSDGTLDNSFNCACENFSYVSSAVVQPDGKIIIAGADGNGVSFARLTADGSRDNSFVNPYQQLGSASVWAVQPDGKVLVATHYSAPFISVTYLSRLNSNGSIDSSFSTLTFNTRPLVQDALNALKVLPDGKILIGGKHNFGYLFRINADGTRDNTFESPALTSSNSQAAPRVYSFGIQSTGQIVISGYFITVNGISRNGFARLNADGSVDLQFTSSISSPLKLVIVSGDKIHLGATRLNSDGTIDNTFNPAFTFSSWELDSSERVVFSGVFTENEVMSVRVGRMNADGSADSSFNMAIFTLSGSVSAIALQPDGKVLFSGGFVRVNGIVRFGLVRVNTDGSLDNTFNSGSPNGYINKIVVQPDGKILIGGYFQNYNGIARSSLARINSDGTLDTAFNPALEDSDGFFEVRAIAIQTDGKILVSGNFTGVSGTARTGLARLNADGSLDNSFNPIIGNSSIFALFVQADGKIMIGGSFTGVNGFNRSNFARLNADGSLDSSFNAGSISNVGQIAQNINGKYTVIAGGTILRRNSDGTADGTFPSPTLESTGGSSAIVLQFHLQADGNIVIVGQFIGVNGTSRNNIARIKPNGFVDTLFFPTGTDGTVNTIAAQADGKFIVGGRFTAIENVVRSGIARIIPPALRTITPFDYDGDGRADVSVFRPSENKWYIYRSSDGQITQRIFAIGGDIPVPADFDGDGKTDMAIFRPSTGDWWSLSSINNNQVFTHWGANGDIPRPSDFDGDGRADYIVFRPTENNWYRISSATGISSTRLFGSAGDKPVSGDFDGDGKSDVAIYRPSTGEWWWQSSVDNIQRATRWGISSDIPAPADYDGDGKTDFAVYRPASGTWYIINSSNGSFTILNFGIAEDKPVAADYDGDGKADIAVFRPSTGIWYLLRSTAGFTALQFGVSSDVPTPNSFVP